MAEVRVGLQDFADRYGVSVRTVKRWRAHGREAEDECPLENPEGMREWWARNMTQQVPAGILAAVAKARKEAGQGELFREKVVKSDGAGETRGAPDALGAIPEGAELGLAGALRRLGEVEWRLSLRATEAGGTKPWLDAISRMTATAEKLRAELEKERKLLPKDEVERVLVELHQPIAGGVRTLLKPMAELLGIKVVPAMEAKWEEICDDFLQSLKGEVLR